MHPEPQLALEHENVAIDEKVDSKYYRKPIWHLKKYTFGVDETYREQQAVFEDGNFSCVISGKSGSGKDTIQQSLLEVDLRQGRTPIVFDVKLEYPAIIFPQRDPALVRILHDNRLLPVSHDVIVWVPFINGLEKNKHFKKLLKYKHPKLQVRPFRILEQDLKSDDTKNFALGMSKMQSFAKDEEDNSQLRGMAKTYKEFKESVAQKYMIFDKADRRPGPDKSACGWEYLDMEELTDNRKVNVVCFYFMIQHNTMTAISIMIALLNELLSIAMHEREQVFAIHIPELQIMLPKRIRQLEETVNTLLFRLTVGFLLMRSFYARARINLQNLSRLPEDLFSQSRLFIGGTRNPKDLQLLRYNFGFPDRWVNKIRDLPVGTFCDVQRYGSKKLFSLAPRSHKAREREPFVKMLQEFNSHPEHFLYETPNYFITDLDLLDDTDRLQFSVGHYRRKVFEWIEAQQVTYPKGLDDEVKMDIVEKARSKLKMSGNLWTPGG